MNTKRDNVACSTCDLLMEIPEIAEGDKATCPRCRQVVSHIPRNMKSKVVSHSLTCLILLLLSNVFPFLTFKAGGQAHEVTLWETLMALWQQGYPILSILIAFFTLIAPILYVVVLLYLALPIRHVTLRAFRIPMCKGLSHLEHWFMVEVLLVSIFISLIKILAIADVEFGHAFWTYLIFAFTFVHLTKCAEPEQLWNWIEDYAY